MRRVRRRGPALPVFGIMLADDRGGGHGPLSVSVVTNALRLNRTAI
jgi:hypothetical protein